MSDTTQLLPVLRECRDAAALYISRCKSESQFDLIPYYEGRRDAFAEIVRHIEHPEDMDELEIASPCPRCAEIEWRRRG